MDVRKLNYLYSRKNNKLLTYYLLKMKIFAFVLFVVLLILSSCKQPQQNEYYTKEEREAVSKRLKTFLGMDSFKIVLNEYRKRGDKIALAIAYRIKGKQQRETSDFYGAIDSHRKGLQFALQVKDTLEMIENSNNLGTDFRRAGMLNEALDYHVQALKYCEYYREDTSYTARKNKVISLNGIGNVQLMLKDYKEAERSFRRALTGEIQLGSEIGKAINYANIGGVKDATGQVDSALVYYTLSLESNIKAKSKLGMSLCHVFFGKSAMKRGEYDEALREYINAYQLLANSNDEWHKLEPCIAIASIYIKRGELDKASEYIDKALKAAMRIKSVSHLAAIYKIKSEYFEKKNNIRQAFEDYRRSVDYTDSVVSGHKIMYLKSIQLNYEREKGKRERERMQGLYKDEQKEKRMFVIGGAVALVLSFAFLGVMVYIHKMRMNKNRAIRKLERVRTLFFTNITHEFRTPLTVIMGLVEHMQKNKTEVSDRHRKYLDTIVYQSRNLLSLVNQLLDILRLTTRLNNDVQWMYGDVVTYVGMVIDGFRYYSSTRSVDLQFVTSQKRIMMDFVPEYFNKIINNIISNSLKFTPSNGTITVKLSCEAHHLVMEIKDTGMGFKEEDLSHVFELFYKGDDGNSVSQGTGIGLTYVKQMTENMEGTIVAANNEEGGAIVTIRIPLRHPGVKSQIWSSEKSMMLATHRGSIVFDEEMEHEESIGQQQVVMVVEDNADVANYISILLQDSYKVINASNGKEALDMATERMPDLILTDVMMPEMGGYELCSEVRKSELLNHIPIVIITAKGEQADVIDGLRAGADAYLQKPFSADELRIRIEHLLAQHMLLREKYSAMSKEGMSDGGVQLTAMDREFLDRLNRIIRQQMTLQDFSAVKLSREMCISHSQLNRKLNAITGLSISSYIFQIRMDYAKECLLTSSKSIADIATSCGYDDNSHFTRSFKQAYGMTPSQFRKRS